MIKRLQEAHDEFEVLVSIPTVKSFLEQKGVFLSSEEFN